VFETVSYDPSNNHSVIRLTITLAIPWENYVLLYG
jgi:hypothetical protein